jgi:hypothetical protein
MTKPKDQLQNQQKRKTEMTITIEQTNFEISQLADLSQNQQIEEVMVNATS